MNKRTEKPPRGVDEAVYMDFRSRMDPDYFGAYTAEEIGIHLRMAASLSTEEPVSIHIRKQQDGCFNITIVARDFFGEFSVICGLITSFGLNILSGDVWTTYEPVRPAETSRTQRIQRRPRRTDKIETSTLIVDSFVVRPRSGQSFGEEEQRLFSSEIRASVLSLSGGRLDEVHERLNPRLTSQLEKIKGELTGLLYPIEVRIDNARSSKWTVMDVRSKDAPAFLYAFSNALAIRNIYIHKVNIRSEKNEVHDEFHIADRHGGKIEDKKRIEVLKSTVALIKQFTRYLPWAPDPAKAMRHFDQFLDKLLETSKRRPAVSFLRQKDHLDVLARLLGTSDFLWEDFLRMQFENLLPILEDFRNRPMRLGKAEIRKRLSAAMAKVRSHEGKKKALNDFKDREMFAIDMIHLLEPHGVLTDFSESLTDLAEAVLDAACEACTRDLTRKHGKPLLEDGRACAFSVCGLGKFGGREMGYASDIELMFVYEGPGRTGGRSSVENAEHFENLAHGMMEFVEAPQEGIFHIDLRLRPHGMSGPYASSYGQWMTYYDSFGEAEPFERQALIKLRWVAGDESLGRRLEAHRDRFVYSAKPWDRDNALHLRGRQKRELVEAGKTNVKHGAGGIIDIEYTAQYLQIIHGSKHRELRTPRTLEALARLEDAGILPTDEHRDLREAYLFLRSLIDALRMVRGNARDLYLPDRGSDEFKYLARRLGYGEANWDKAVEKLSRDIGRHMERVRHIFENRFVKPKRPQRSGR